MMQRVMPIVCTLLLVACSGGGRAAPAPAAAPEHEFSGIRGFDAGAWDGAVLAVVRGESTIPRAKPKPCLAVIGVMRSAAEDAFYSPQALPIGATIDGVEQIGELNKCAPVGDGARHDVFARWSERVAPGAEVGFSRGFTSFEGELPDSLQVRIGRPDLVVVEFDVDVTDVVPALPEFEIGDVPDRVPADTSFTFDLVDLVVESRIIGYDVVLDPDAGHCVRLFGESVASVEIGIISPVMMAPPPMLVVNGVASGPWPGFCMRGAPEGYFYKMPDEIWITGEPWPADQPYGLIWAYGVPADATVQGAIVIDRGEAINLTLVELDSPPPAPMR